MENQKDEYPQTANQVYEYVVNMIINGKKNSFEIKNALIDRGLNEEDAIAIIASIEQQIEDAKRGQSNKDMLYGALWCIGGTVATLADVGYIFWGAIVFGAIQFFKGVARV
jgi:hypothetical protein